MKENRHKQEETLVKNVAWNAGGKGGFIFINRLLWTRLAHSLASALIRQFCHFVGFPNVLWGLLSLI